MYGVSAGDFTATATGDAQIAEGSGGRVMVAALRQWMRGQSAWLGDVTSRRVRRALGSGDSAFAYASAAASDRSVPAVLIEASRMVAMSRLGGSGGLEGDLLIEPPRMAAGDTDPPRMQQAISSQLESNPRVTQLVAPPAPEAVERAEAVSRLQLESRRNGQRRIAPVLVTVSTQSLPQQQLNGDSADGAATAPGLPSMEEKAACSGSAAAAPLSAGDAQRWMSAWADAPQPAEPPKSAAAAILGEVSVVSWVSSTLLRRLFGDREAALCHEVGGHMGAGLAASGRLA